MTSKKNKDKCGSILPRDPDEMSFEEKVQFLYVHEKVSCDLIVKEVKRKKANETQ